MTTTPKSYWCMCPGGRKNHDTCATIGCRCRYSLNAKGYEPVPKNTMEMPHDAGCRWWLFGSGCTCGEDVAVYRTNVEPAPIPPTPAPTGWCATVLNMADGIFEVRSPGGMFDYIVNVRGGSCSCAAFTYGSGKWCKHLCHALVAWREIPFV